jgi:hypothetical protein
LHCSPKANPKLKLPLSMGLAEKFKPETVALIASSSLRQDELG